MSPERIATVEAAGAAPGLVSVAMIVVGLVAGEAERGHAQGVKSTRRTMPNCGRSSSGVSARVALSSAKSTLREAFGVLVEGDQEVRGRVLADGGARACW